jgi:hypothetical protein
VHQYRVEKETISSNGIFYAAVDRPHAYDVLSATVSFRFKRGKSGNRHGVLTFAFAKQGDQWKVESQAWGVLSGHLLLFLPFEPYRRGVRSTIREGLRSSARWHKFGYS